MAAAVTFPAPVAEERYRWLAATRRQLPDDTPLKRADKGLLQAFLRKVTGYYLRALLTRLVGR